MRPVDLLRLLLLAAIWGSSFLFMRLVAPALGPLLTAELRVLLAGLALLAWFRATGTDLGLRANRRFFVIVGTVNSGVPFALFAYAALHIPAAYSAVLNATAPLFGVICAAVWLRERVTPARVAGLALGIAGVAVMVGVGPVQPTPQMLLAVGAGLAAPLCYGLAATYIKLHGAGIRPGAVAAGSQLGAALTLLPALPLWPAPALHDPALLTPLVLACTATLALVCGAVAYLLYFRLVEDTGPARALTVTLLIPVFGMGWGALFLGERITPAMAAGAASIVAGLVLLLDLRQLFRGRSVA